MRRTKLKKALLRKTIATTILLAILAFSVISANTLPVKADKVGIGKFLTVEIEGGGYVTATKERSGDIWHYYPTVPPTEHKLGAGTVSIEAFADTDNGWEFSHWEEDLAGIANPTEYKSVKYGYVRAVFIKTTFTITAIVAAEAPNGIILTTVDGDIITIGTTYEVPVEAGADQTFNFEANPENHVSTIWTDTGYIPYALSYTFYEVQEDLTIKVFFS